MTDQQTPAKENPETQRRPQPMERVGETGRALINAIMEGSPAVVTFLAIVAALALGALLIAVTNTTVLHAWGRLFSDPGNAFAQAWDAISAAYRAMFDGAIFSPATIGAAFHGGSVGAIFYPISQSLSDATPLMLSGCRSRSPSGPSCSTSARPGSGSAARSSRRTSASRSACRRSST